MSQGNKTFIAYAVGAKLTVTPREPWDGEHKKVTAYAVEPIPGFVVVLDDGQAALHVSPSSLKELRSGAISLGGIQERQDTHRACWIASEGGWEVEL